MWQSQTYKHARHFFFSIFLSPRLSLSSFLSVISIRATNDNAASSNFDWSHIFDTHTFFFFFFYDSPCFSLSSASSIVCVSSSSSSSSSFFFRAYRHRAYQWNFRTAADASGDDINTHIVLFITSGFLLDRNLRCIHTHTHTIEQIQFFRLMSKNINFELARDRKKKANDVISNKQSDCCKRQ
jgi:hypothetical protein